MSALVMAAFSDSAQLSHRIAAPTCYSFGTLPLVAATRKVATVSVEAEFYKGGNLVMVFNAQHLRWK